MGSHISVTVLLLLLRGWSALAMSSGRKFELHGVLTWQASETAAHKVTVNTSISEHKVDPKFLAVAIGPRSISTNWLGSRRLKTLAAALAPCEIRVGGTRANFLTFDPNAQGAEQPADANWFNPEARYDNFTVSGSQWTTFNTFLEQVGWDLLFDFNVFYRKDGVWNPSNADQLLNYSAQRGIDIPYFQLGNEPNAYPKNFNITISPETLLGDYRILKNLLATYPQYSNSRLCGPDVSNIYGHGSTRGYLYRFIASGASDVVDEISLHHYYLGWATESEYLSVSVLEDWRLNVELAIQMGREGARPLPVRYTETSSSYNGGTPGLSDTYIDGFLWLDKLGVAAKLGVTRVFRQTLLVGSYALLNGDFSPRPDYYLSVLYKKLIEGPVFSVHLDPPNANLRVYGHCARAGIYNPGALIVYYLNLQNESAVISLAQYPNADLDLYLLTPGDDKGLKSSYAKLNGKILLMPSDTLPDLLAATHKGDVTVEAHTFGFIVVPQANVPLCVKYYTDKANGTNDKKCQ